MKISCCLLLEIYNREIAHNIPFWKKFFKIDILCMLLYMHSAQISRKCGAFLLTIYPRSAYRDCSCIFYFILFCYKINRLLEKTSFRINLKPVFESISYRLLPEYFYMQNDAFKEAIGWRLCMWSSEKESLLFSY